MVIMSTEKKWKPIIMIKLLWTWKMKSLPDQGIHFLGLDAIHFLYCILYLLFVSTDVNNEDKSVVIFNFLHCRLSCEGIFEDLILVKLVPGRSTDARVLRISFLLQCPWPVKCNWCSYFLGFLLKSHSTWFHCLGNLLGMGFWITLFCGINCIEKKSLLRLGTTPNNAFTWM